MKILVACAGCHRQFDASGIAAGSRFRCTCGQVVEVPKARGHDAAVVRCASCGGPRKGNASVCRYCQAEFTLHDQDLQVVCANCMARVSTKARFCHHCATPVAPGGDVGTQTHQYCPACSPPRRLNSRRLGKQSLAVLECGSCAGMWLGSEAFQLLAERARERALPESVAGGESTTSGSQAGRMYRKCPQCRKAMNRSNFATKSGVIIDRCKPHGIWFDPGELDGVLRWIKQGGEDRAHRRQQQEQHEARRRASLQTWQERSGSPLVQTAPRSRSESLTGGIIELLSMAFDL